MPLSNLYQQYLLHVSIKISAITLCHLYYIPKYILYYYCELETGEFRKVLSTEMLKAPRRGADARLQSLASTK